MMKKFVLAAFFVLAVGAMAQAQEKNSVLQQANAFNQRFMAAINSDDPAKAASVYTSDAVLVGPTGVVTAPPNAAQNFYTATYKQFGGKFTVNNTVTQARINGNTMWLVGESVVQTGSTSGRTHFAIVAVRSKGSWKAQMLSVGTTPPAPAAPSR